MNKLLFLLIPCLVLFLNACAELPHSSTPAAFPPKVSDNPTVANNEGLLEYAARFIELSAEAQKKELAQINQEINQDKGDINRKMKAAMIYALPGSRQRDVVKAQVLLDDILREKTLNSEQKIMASLLKDQINETGKLTQEINKLTQKARDEQKRADALQQKLNELRDIEKTMVDRDQSGRK